MQVLKCMFCGKTTTIHKISVKRKIGEKIVTVTNAPVYYCADCKETFLSKEVQDFFSYIRKNGLQEKTILFNFDAY